MQLAPLWERVPPPAYGGIEYVVSLLSEELGRLGHEVILAASGDSRTSARLFSVFENSLRTSDVADREPYMWLHVAAALQEARDAHVDIVHNHASELAMAMQHLSPVPMLTTMHNAITPDHRPVWDAYQGYWNTPSRAARRGLTFPNFAGVIHHGIDVESFPFEPVKDEYLLFLSRMSPEKGPVQAIQAARRLGKKLIMAGKVDRYNDTYFHAEVEPLIDGNEVEFLGEADAKLKRELYAKAKCLLFPISWNEPFGLVMAEAMASGTPVVAFGRGAAPEVVAHGLSGFIVDDVDGMAAAVRDVHHLDPRAIREYVRGRFSAEAMARGYVRAYTSILEEHVQQRRRNQWSLVSGPTTAAG